MTRNAGRITVGLDVGGAHLKIARLVDGTPVAAQQFQSPLWLGLDRLEDAFGAAAPLLADADFIALTMTGEMSRIFDHRDQGVARIIEVTERATGQSAIVWMGKRGFGCAEDAPGFATDIASANFLAPAIYAAAAMGSGLFVDMGSTTTDIIGLSSEYPTVEDVSDAGRLASGELIYTGLTRTSLMAVTDRVPVGGRWRRLVNETYADMGDVYRLLSLLPEDVDVEPTLDKRSKSLDDTVARIARMTGEDSICRSMQEWFDVAKYFAEAQHRQILDGFAQVLSRLEWQSGSKIVSAGVGAHIVANLAKRLGYACVSFADVALAPESCATAVTRYAPAVAVAMLFEAQQITPEDEKQTA